MSDICKAAQALLARWDSPQWEWAKHGPTADLIADLRAALAQPEAQPEAQPVSKIGDCTGTLWVHRRTGGRYEVLAEAKIEATCENVIVYRSTETGSVWVRPRGEFLDGRFVADQPTADGPTLPMPVIYQVWADQMLAFRDAAVAQERERCAKVCDDLAANDKLSNYYAVAARAIRKG